MASTIAICFKVEACSLSHPVNSVVTRDNGVHAVVGRRGESFQRKVFGSAVYSECQEHMAKKQHAVDATHET